MTYGSAPISDFGIAKGLAMPFNPEVLAFCLASEPGDNHFFVNQDPREIFWLYFTTIRGENLYIDCGLHIFGALLIDTQSYVSLQRSADHP
jgi:hypothetical protein